MNTVAFTVVVFYYFRMKTVLIGVVLGLLCLFVIQDLNMKTEAAGIRKMMRSLLVIKCCMVRCKRNEVCIATPKSTKDPICRCVRKDNPWLITQ